MQENGLIRMVTLLSKFVISLTGKQKITIQIPFNISRNDNEIRQRFDHLMEYILRHTFLRNHGENEAGKLVPDFSLVFQKLCMM